MNLKAYIKSQKITKDTKKVKLQFLKSVSELLLMPNTQNLKATVKYLSILANSYHIPITAPKLLKDANIETLLLNKTSEIIKNNNGYNILIPEMLKIIVSYAKIKCVELKF